MSKMFLAAAFAFAVASFAHESEAKTIVVGGDVQVEVTYPLLSLSLWGTAAPGSPAAELTEAGNPVLTFPIQASRGSEFTGGSQVVDGGYDLRMNGGLYLFPLNAEGTELELFDDEGNRLCCRNALTNLALDTTTGKLTGRINGVRNRENDHLFTLGETTDEGTELLVSDYLAGMLTYAYSANNAQYFPLFDQWPNKDAGIPNLAGQSIGWVNYDVVTDVLPAPVPVPAALPLLIGGIGALGYVGKRRRRKAA